jgi:hypothetical protein
MSPPDDANDLRGFHFKRLLGKPATWIATAIAVLGAGVAGVIVLGATIGAGGAGAVLLLALLVVFAIADSKAEDAFFATYAEQRGMALLEKKGPLPPATPLLRKGDTATPSGRSPAHSPTESKGSSPSTPTRWRAPTERATGRPTTTATRSALPRCPSA